MDVGKLDEAGFLFLYGRSDEVFKSAGQKVSCPLIAQKLVSLETFKDVVVVPGPDKLLGMALKCIT